MSTREKVGLIALVVVGVFVLFGAFYLQTFGSPEAVEQRTLNKKVDAGKEALCQNANSESEMKLISEMTAMHIYGVGQNTWNIKQEGIPYDKVSALVLDQEALTDEEEQKYAKLLTKYQWFEQQQLKKGYRIFLFRYGVWSSNFCKP